MKKSKNIYLKFLIIAVFVTILVIVLDAVVMSLAFKMGTFSESLIYSDPQEAWMRFLIATGIFTSCIYAAKAAYTIQSSRDEAIVTKELLQSVLNTIPVRVFWKSKDLTYLGCNTLFANDAGVSSADDLTGKDDFQLSWSKEAELYRADDLKVITSGAKRLNYEEPQTRPDGSVFWLNTSKIPLCDSNGEVYGVLGTYEDITKRKEKEHEIKELNATLEERVEDRTRELDAINKELESFSYSVSHDLRAPLRAINGFGEALYEDYSDKLGEEGRDYLRRMHAATLRMGRLIDDLLALSRVTRGKIKKSETDISALAWQVIEELKANEEDKSIEFNVTPNLTAECDEHLIEVVLTNLINNAIKFSKGKKDRKIVFGTSKVNNGLAYYVRDNGAGFDPLYKAKLFSPFQRLHATAEFEGVGVGLATVQRIIHRHGGLAWAEGAVDKGATFYFTLPRI